MACLLKSTLLNGCFCAQRPRLIGSEEQERGRKAMEVRAVLNDLFMASMTGDVGKIEVVLQSEKTKHPELTLADLLRCEEQGSDFRISLSAVRWVSLDPRGVDCQPLMLELCVYDAAASCSHYKDANGRTAVHFAGHGAKLEVSS